MEKLLSVPGRDRKTDYPRPLFFHQRKPINPMIAIGAAIRYMMPVFKALAGLWPNCWAVFVQMEHCASTLLEVVKRKAINSVIIHLFIFVPFRKDTISVQFQLALINITFNVNCYMFD
jgi:hypothetical protein